MREFTIGEHRSLFHGTGFDFVGLRDWQAGDRFSAIDWPQSSLTNFSPLIVREFEQPSTANVVVVADGSLSTRCGIDGVPIAAAIARAIATIGMSAVFFQDMFGLMTFDVGFAHLGAVRPRIGKNHVIHCLDAYQHQRGLQDVKQSESISRSIAGFMRKTSLIPVISDFLFDDPGDVLRELARLNSTHDVFLIVIDAAFAFELPKSLGRLDRSVRRRNRRLPRDVARRAAKAGAPGPRVAGRRRADGEGRRPRRAAAQPGSGAERHRAHGVRDGTAAAQRIGAIGDN